MRRHCAIERARPLGALRKKLEPCGQHRFPVQRLELRAAGCAWDGPRPVANTPSVAARLLRSHYADMAQEAIVVLLLNSTTEVVSAVELSLGNVASAPVDPRLLFGAVLSTGAPAFILAHNHPSGNATPSTLDIALTKQVKASAQALGLNFLDHVIVTESNYYSFLEHGAL